MTAVLDLSPTMSGLNKVIQTEGLSPNLLSSGDYNAKFSPRFNGGNSTNLISYENKNECSNTHSFNLKYESSNPAFDSLQLPVYEEPISNPPLIHYDVENLNLGLLSQTKNFPPTKFTKDNAFNGICSEFQIEERSMGGNKPYIEHIIYRGDSSSLSLGGEDLPLPSLLPSCNTSRPPRVTEELILQHVQRIDYSVTGKTSKHRSNKYSSPEALTQYNLKENSKVRNE